MELLRHTIEFIKGKLYGNNLLLKVKDEVKLVINATLNYEVYDRQKVIDVNKKNTIRHAYFREYINLQRLFSGNVGLIYPEADGADDLELWMNRGSTFEENVEPRDDISITKHGLKIPTDAACYDDFAAKMTAFGQEFRQVFIAC